MNVLLTCAGRRNYLLEYFRAAVSQVGKVYAADSDPDAPAMLEADEALVVPPIQQPDYVDHLLKVCRQYEIGLVCSLNDLELPVLAPHRERFAQEGTTVVVSSPEVIRTCGDKWVTYVRLTEWGIPTAKTYLSLSNARTALLNGDISFPVVVKPRWGTASIGIEFPADFEELAIAHRLTELRCGRTIIGGMSAADPERAVLVQELLPGREHGLDVINDLRGRYVTTFAKRKLTMRAGETDRAVTVYDGRLEALGEALGTLLGHVGNLDCDVFVGDDGRIGVLELNPRFGGGYPFSHEAGADVPAALVAWAAGRPAEDGWLSVRPGVATSKCDRLVVRSVRHTAR